jgi:hypothetical protein
MAALSESSARPRGFLFLFSFTLRVVVAVASSCAILLCAVFEPPENVSSAVFLGIVATMELVAESVIVVCALLLRAVVTGRAVPAMRKTQPPTFREPVAAASPDDDESSETSFVTLDSSMEDDSSVPSVVPKKGPFYAPDHAEPFDPVVFEMESPRETDFDGDDVDGDFVFVKMTSPPESESSHSSTHPKFASAVPMSWMSSDSDFEDIPREERTVDIVRGVGGEGSLQHQPSEQSSGDETDDDDDDFEDGDAPVTEAPDPFRTLPSSLAWEGRVLPRTTALQLQNSTDQNPLEDLGPSRRPF